jgi:hypothetical protein
MAIANIKAPRKTRSKPRSAKALDMANIGFLPDWKTIESHEDPRFDEMLHDALRHYGYFNKPADMRKSMEKWLAVNVTDKKTLKAWKKTPDWRTPVPAYSLVCASLAGMPMKDEHFDYVVSKVKEAIAKSIAAGEVVAEKKKKDAPSKLQLVSSKLDRYINDASIQDRISAKIDEHILHIEETWEDDIIENKAKHPKPEIKAYLATENVPASMIDRIVNHFQANLDEIAGSQGKNADEDLKEAYAHLKRPDVKRFTDFYNALIANLKMYKEEKKVQRAPRARKAQPKSKQVAKLNFMKKHEGLKLVSVSPEDIIDCKELWVYQTKYRKLGKYVTDGYTTLGVKGTSITGFDTTKSVQKTLRKPAEQLAEFKKAGKVKLRTFMNDVKAVEIKLTGRINKDTILLKVQK